VKIHETQSSLTAAGQPYWEALSPHVPRLLSLLDRAPASISFGSFDREHWSWKFRDFPLGMLQAGVYPLALLWKHPFPGSAYFRSEEVRGWIAAAIECTLERQHRDGSFDGFAPFEREAGVTLGVMHGLCEAFRIARNDLPVALCQRFLAAAARAFRMALQHPQVETHAFVSNHWALFAVAFLDAHELLGDATYLRRANQLVDRIVAEQFADGCYREYDGADPGYESLGLHHLATFWQRAPRADLLASLRRSLEFYAHFVCPDGSVGGAQGSRNTRLWFPGGFEILRQEIPTAGAIADFMKARISSGNVATPAVADAENLVPLAYSYLEAARAATETASEPLPHQGLQSVVFFEGSGMLAAGGAGYYAVVGAQKGGACSVFSRAGGERVYEDAGYLIETSAGKCISQRLAGGRVSYAPMQRKMETGGACTVFAPMLPTSFRFLLLRMFQLSLGRIPALARMSRNWIVQRLILAAAPGPVQFQREITFYPDRIELLDAFRPGSAAGVRSLQPVRALTHFIWDRRVTFTRRIWRPHWFRMFPRHWPLCSKGKTRRCASHFAGRKKARNCCKAPRCAIPIPNRARYFPHHDPHHPARL